MGYQVQNRKLFIKEGEAAAIRMIFERFVELGSVTCLAQRIAAEGVRSRNGKLLDRAALYKLLGNRVYLGEAVHKGVAYPGEHQAIVDRKLWDKVRSILQESPRARAGHTRAETPALLKGLLYGPTGRAMSPTHTRRGNRLPSLLRQPSCPKTWPVACTVRRVPTESRPPSRLSMLRSPEAIIATACAARPKMEGLKTRFVKRSDGWIPFGTSSLPPEQAPHRPASGSTGRRRN
jgi:hypothetical protein